MGLRHNLRRQQPGIGHQHDLGRQRGLLAAAVPADRLITGRVPPSEQMPYVRLEPAGGSETHRTNASLYATQRVNFHIWTDTFDSGRAIAPLIRNAFASNAFNWGNGAVLDMKSDGPPLSRQTDTPEIKAWQTTLSFTCHLTRAGHLRHNIQQRRLICPQ